MKGNRRVERKSRAKEDVKKRGFFRQERGRPSREGEGATRRHQSSETGGGGN